MALVLVSMKGVFSLNEGRVKNLLALCFLVASALAGCANTAHKGDSVFDPAAEGAVLLFAKACVELYPRNDGSLERWLAQPGIRKLDRGERAKFSTQSSVEYAIQSVAVYSLVVEEKNLCVVRAMDLNPSTVSASLSTFRAGVVKSGLGESVEKRESHRRKHESYRYTRGGAFVMRLDYSYGDKVGVVLSTVSNLRSANLQ